MRIPLLTRHATQNWINRIGLSRYCVSRGPTLRCLDNHSVTTTPAAAQWKSVNFEMSFSIIPKNNEKNQHNFYGTSSRIVFVHFLEELKVTERNFENN